MCAGFRGRFDDERNLCVLRTEEPPENKFSGYPCASCGLKKSGQAVRHARGLIGAHGAIHVGVEGTGRLRCQPPRSCGAMGIKLTTGRTLDRWSCHSEPQSREAGSTPSRPLKCLSRVLGNSYARFLEGQRAGNGPLPTCLHPRFPRSIKL